MMILQAFPSEQKYVHVRSPSFQIQKSAYAEQHTGLGPYILATHKYLKIFFAFILHLNMDHLYKCWFPSQLGDVLTNPIKTANCYPRKKNKYWFISKCFTFQLHVTLDHLSSKLCTRMGFGGMSGGFKVLGFHWLHCFMSMTLHSPFCLMFLL